MTTDSDGTIDAQAMAVVVEMGSEFTPGPRTAAALAELVDALNDEHGPETQGFTFEPLGEIRNFAFVTPDAEGAVAELKWENIVLKRGYTGG